MSLIQDVTNSNYIITSFEPNCVYVNYEAFYTSLIVSSDKLVRSWNVTNINQLDESNLIDVFNIDPEIVLIGTGESLIPLHPELLAMFSQKKVGVEVMNTSAVCRTYGILTSDGRRVAAAIIFS